MTSLDRVLALLNCQKSGAGFIAKCPAHDDNKPSLSINVGHGGKVLLHCHAGCTVEQIVGKLGLTLADLFPQNDNGMSKVVALYDYPDEHGDLLFQVVRFDPKDFKQRRRDGNGGWVWNLKGVRRVLYRLPQILKAETVYVVEGEKDADRLWALGVPATTSPHGAGKWQEEYSRHLASKRVTILLDNDESGEQHALQVARSLLPGAAAVKIVRLPGLPPKGDVSDWLDDGHTKEELMTLVEAAPILRAEDFSHQEHRENTTNDEQTPWARAKSAPAFLAEEEKDFQGLAKDLLAPGALTLIDSPKGIGKTQVVHAVAVALATGGIFRGERVPPVKVLLLDRENPVSTLKKRLRAWGAVAAENLHVLTRQDAPDLKDCDLWAKFPAEDYDVLIVDSVGASTEGITEKEGKQNSEVLATLLDLAHKDIAILLLQNTEKTGTNIRGRGEWADRADIQYEVRDATGFTPSGKRPWWLELPADGAANWAERAARRKGRTEYRLAFIPAKFRLAAEPDPFCLEISLPENEPWTLRDVTAEILKAGEENVAKAEQEKSEKIKKAAEALAAVVKDRAATEEPILKKEAETFLCQETNLSQKMAREVINNYAGKLWKIEPLQGQKGHPQALFPLSQTDEQPKSDTTEKPHEMWASEGGISVDPDKSSNRNGLSLESASNGGSEDELFRSPRKSRATETGSQKSPSNVGYRDTSISVAGEVETEDLSVADTKDTTEFDWQTGEQATAGDEQQEEGEL